MTVLVSLQPLGCILTSKEEDPEAASAPASADLKVDTVSLALRFMAGGKHAESNHCTANIDRQPPGEGTKIKFPVGQVGIRCRFSQFHGFSSIVLQLPSPSEPSFLHT